MNEAKSKAKDTIEESEMRSKQIIADMEDRLKGLVDNYKKLETAREDLMADLKRLGNDLLERVERAKNTTRDFDADKHLYTVKREAKKIAFPNLDYERPPKGEARPDPKPEAVKSEEPKVMHVLADEPEPEPVPVTAETTPKVQKVHKSFFDEIN
jgi:cell division initiation protein